MGALVAAPAGHLTDLPPKRTGARALRDAGACSPDGRSSGVAGSVRIRRRAFRLPLAVGALLLALGASPAAALSDGVPITAELAQQLFDRLAPVQAADGCRLARFDTQRFRIAIAVRTPAGAEHQLELASAPMFGGGGTHRAGEWALDVPPVLARDCAATLDAYVRALAEVEVPASDRLPGGGRAPSGIPNQWLLAATLGLLVLGTIAIVVRELRAQPAARVPALALAMIWAASLALRLLVSPATFLHEFYHIADIIPGYLSGELAPVYGKAGPTLYRLAGALLDRPNDVGVVFLTNAIVSSLAVPAAALLTLGVTGSWPQALCAAVLLGVLPQHLRYAHAEDLFVVALTFMLWAAALGALYMRTRRLGDALCCALATSLATQSRPEMVFAPAVVPALWVCTAPQGWRLLFTWRTLTAAAVLALLLVPRGFELHAALTAGGGPPPRPPDLWRYIDRLVLLNPAVTPPLYWLALVVGVVWGVICRPGWVLWLLLLFVAWSLFSQSMFDNPPYHLRAQLLPGSFLILLGAGIAPVWLALWGARRRAAVIFGAALLAVAAAAIVVQRQPFITELRDQQLQWTFLEHTVPQLPAAGTLLTAVDQGGRNLDAFPEFLLRHADKRYALVDVRRAARGDAAWPAPGAGVLYYQGMFCYFAWHDEPTPAPLTPTCQAVHDRYVLEPLAVETLDVPGYSPLRYADPPYRIGFYRLVGGRP